MASQMGLGKGLQALIKETADTYQPKEIHTLPLKDIIPNPNQPRREFAEEALAELAESIQRQGLLQPILVRPLEGAEPQKYEIVAGERRYRASKKAGLLEVPVVVRPFTDQESLTAALVENIQRESLNPMEEALALQALKQQYHLSQEDLAAHLGKSRSTIANSLRLLVLTADVQESVAQGSITAGHARALLSISDPVAQEDLHAKILAEQLSVREAEGLASIWKEHGSFTPPMPATEDFSPAQAELEASEAYDAYNTGNDEENPVEERTGGRDLSDEEWLKEVAAIAAEAEVLLADNPEKPAAEPKAPVTKKPQSAILVAAQMRFTQMLQRQVKVTGKENKGKITIPFSSQEELDKLLTLIEQLPSQPE